jgi:hypothetical protein
MVERDRADVLNPCRGAVTEALIGFLSFDEAAAFFELLKTNPSPTRERWKPRPLDESVVRFDLGLYAYLGWGMIRYHRGLSARCRLAQCLICLWLLGDEATMQTLESTSFPQYGGPMLAVICRAHALPIPEDTILQRMIQGEPCRPGCKEGCGPGTLAPRAEREAGR